MESTTAKVKSSKILRLVISAIIVFGAVTPLLAANGNKNTQRITTNEHYQFLDINNIFTMYSNNGDGAFNKYLALAGFEWPKGSSKAPIFEDGLLYGGIWQMDNSLRVGGSAYRHGWQAGRIVNPGTAITTPTWANPDDTHNRVYRVRPDVNPLTPFDANMDNLLKSENDLISRYDASSTTLGIYNQYIADWNEWPANEGAPYTDVNHNGIYEPSIDIPGIPGADQTLWHVSNDMDVIRMISLYGSQSMGIEMQRTIWAYNRPGPLGNMIFTDHKLINKSGYAVNNMYLALWSDPDVGNAGDDFIGCDTLMSLGFAYNAASIDQIYGLHPPASGYDFLQGPIVPSSGDTAIFGFKRKPGFKNLPMTSFNMFINANTIYLDPPQGTYAGTTQWYNLMQGLSLNGTPILNPQTRKVTKYYFAGDPVLSSGWTDGTLLPFTAVESIPPGDRRMAVNSGPFTFSPGDTQEVVAATIVGQGVDNRTSITDLRNSARIAQLFVENSWILPPSVSVMPQDSGGTSYLRIVADARGCNAASLSVLLRNYDGVLRASTQLFDDGNHGDGAAGDGIFSEEILYSQTSSGTYMDLHIVRKDNAATTFSHIIDNITTLSSVHIGQPVIVSDNLNGDGIANPGENVRVSLTIVNASSANLSHLVLYGGDPWSTVQIGNCAASSSITMKYSPLDFNSYLSFTMPAVMSDSTVRFPISMKDDNYNIWIDSVEITVHPLTQPIKGSPIAHTAGKCVGDFSISVFDATKVLPHRYVISGTDSLLFNPADSSWTPLFSLRDSTANVLLLDNQPIPDPLGHNAAIVSGFKILRGSVATVPSFQNYVLASTERWHGGGDNVLGLEGYGGTIGTAFEHWYTSSSSPIGRLKEVQINFAATDAAGIFNVSDPKVSMGYRYLFAADQRAQPGFGPFIINTAPGLPFQDFTKSIPFSAYDVDSDPPRRLAVGFTENNKKFGSVDGKYWPPVYNASSAYGNNTGSLGPLEWFFIFDVNYSETLDATLAVNLMTTKAPIMWVGMPTREADEGWNGTEQSLIKINHSLSSNDRWSFDPTITTGIAGKGSIVQTFQLMQNYPNPFNPATTIRYTLPVAGKTVITIFNVLGQEVKRLVEAVEPAGDKSVVWNGSDKFDRQVSSGVYFYRITATSVGVPGRSYSSVKKMILLR